MREKGYTKMGGNMKKIVNILLSVILILSCTACSGVTESGAEISEHISSNSSQGSKIINEEFDDFLEELFIDSVTTDSITLHYTLKDPEAYGIEEMDPTFGDVDFNDLEKEDEELQETIDKLNTFDRSTLSAEQQTVYDILSDYLDLQKSSQGLEYYGSLFGTVSGIHNNLPITLAEYQFYKEKDIQDIISLLNQVPDYFEKCIEYEKKRSELGLFMADFAVDEVISQCEDFIADPNNNFLIEIFSEKIESFDGLSEEVIKEYTDQIEDAVLNTVIPAYRMLIAELTDLKGTGTNQLGLSYYPEGKRYYEFLVKYETGSEKSVDELLELTENALLESLMSMYTVYSNNQDAYNYFYENALDIGMSDSREILEYFKETMKTDYPEGPQVEYAIKTVHASLEDSLSPAFYMIPPIDEANENVIYLNMGDQYADNDTLFATLAHEGYPGHLYQTTFFNEVNDYPIRSILNFGGYVEGWATYVEIHSYEMVKFSQYSEEMTTLAQANTILSLAASSIIDIGVNYFGWTIEDTAEFMDEYGLNSEIAEELVKYVIEEPGNYLKYFIGYLEFQELEDYAKEELGDMFDAVEFHKALLTIGPAQFKYVKESVDDYIDLNK